MEISLNLHNSITEWAGQYRFIIQFCWQSQRMRKARKKEVQLIVQDILGKKKPSDRAKLIQFERCVAQALRSILKQRLNTKFLKSRWFKDAVRDRFQKCKVKKIRAKYEVFHLRNYRNTVMHFWKQNVTI